MQAYNSIVDGLKCLEPCSGTGGAWNFFAQSALNKFTWTCRDHVASSSCFATRTDLGCDCSGCCLERAPPTDGPCMKKCNGAYCLNFVQQMDCAQTQMLGKPCR